MGNFAINEFGEAVITQNGSRKAGAPAPKKKTLADIMKAGRRQANAAKRTAAETQDFLKCALQNCKNQGDLDAIRDLVKSHGTPKQRKAFEKMEYDLTHITGKKKAAIGNLVESVRQHAEAKEAPAPQAPASEPVLGEKQKRRMEIAKQRAEKLANKENFRQAMLNAESAEDLKALEKEYGKKFTGSLKSTYNARMHALEKAAAQRAAQHAEMQTAYDKLFAYGNGKHPSVTPLGTAQSTSSKGMTWEKYAKQHGLSYSKPISGVGEADRLAKEIIARNNTVKPMEMTPEARAIYERVDGQLHKRTPVKPYEYPLSGKSAAESATAFELSGDKGVDGGKNPPVDPPVDNGSNGGKKPPVDPPVDNGSNGGKKPPVDPPVDNGSNGGKKPPVDPPVDNGSNGGKKPPVDPPVDNGSNGGKKPPVDPPVDNGSNGGKKPPVDPPVDNGSNGGKKPPVDPPVDNGSNGGKKPPIDKGGKTKGKGFKMPKLGKKGKFALAALVVGLIGAGIAYLSKSKKAAPTTPSGEPIKPGFIPADTTKTEKVDTLAMAPVVADTIPAQKVDSLLTAPILADTISTQKADTILTTPVVNPVLEEKPVASADTIEAKVVSEIPRDNETGKYIVKKGDNCWNIVKAEILKEKGAETLSEKELDKEIIRRLPKFLKDNDLHYEKDKYTVLIYPNDTLNIKM